MALSSSLENASSSGKKLRFLAARLAQRGLRWVINTAYQSSVRLAETLKYEGSRNILRLHFSEDATPLYTIGGKAAFPWDSKHKQAFRDLILRLTNPHPLPPHPRVIAKPTHEGHSEYTLAF